MRVGTGILLMILLMSTRARKNTTARARESEIAGLHALLDEVMWMMQSSNVNDANEVFNE